MSNALSSIKAGDPVLFRFRGGRFQKAVVEKVTPSGRIKVQGTTFRPNGYEIGGDMWRKSYIDPFDQTILDRQAVTERKLQMRRACQNADWLGMDESVVAAIYALLPKKAEGRDA